MVYVISIFKVKDLYQCDNIDKVHFDDSKKDFKTRESNDLVIIVISTGSDIKLLEQNIISLKSLIFSVFVFYPNE